MRRRLEIIVFITLSVAFCFTTGTLPAQEKPDLPPGIISKEPARTFRARVNKINASEKFFEAIARQPDHGPVINLNLLRYRPRGNSAVYDRYGAKAGPEILALGGDIVIHGKANTKTETIFEFSESWDGVAFVLYPRRSSYIQLQRSEAYQDGIADRVAGTYERLLYVLSDGDAIYNAGYSIEQLHKKGTRIAFKDGDIFVSELLRFREPDGRDAYVKFAQDFRKVIKEFGGEVILSVRAEMPVVSEEIWDHFVSFRYPSMDALKKMYKSDKFHEANANRIKGLEATIAVLFEPTPLPD